MVTLKSVGKDFGPEKVESLSLSGLSDLRFFVASLPHSSGFSAQARFSFSDPLRWYFV